MTAGANLLAMQLTQLFREEDVVVPFQASDKWDALRRLVDGLVQHGRLTAAQGESVHEAVLARERSMSTGMEQGIAIPHAAVDDVPEVVATLGVVQAEGGLEFESIDGRPTHFVVLLVVPRAQKLLHIRTLADVARVLSKPDVRQALLEAEDARAAWNALA